MKLKNVYPDEIANYLVDVTNAPDSYRDTMTDVLYNLRAICENEYNSDGYRQLYNALAIVASAQVELTVKYYERDTKPEYSKPYVYRVKATTPDGAMKQYYDSMENHDLAKYTPEEIYTIETYRPETWGN